MTLILAILLAQAAPTCATGVQCSTAGFESSAPLNYGSGTPDFTCGNTHDLPDGGWGSASKYCLIVTRESAGYDGYHGDLTIMAARPRSAGWLLFVGNQYFGSGFPVFNVSWDGRVWSLGGYEASGNGGGLRNRYSYLAVSGRSTTPTLIPDVITAGGQHGGYNFGIWNGAGWPFRVRDNGAVSFPEAIDLSFQTTDDALRITQALPDGGTRAAILRWQ